MRGLALTAILVAGTLLAGARVPMSQIRFHNIDSDTTRIVEILNEAVKIADPNERVMMIAEKFIGVPYVASTLETDDCREVLTVNLDELDCTTFVQVVLALAMTAGDHRTSWRDFVDTLEETRYRGGEMDGYPSRLHYTSDWIVDNIHRGKIIEATGLIPDYRTTSKTFDFMSKNADKYPALADSANLAQIKSVEMGYRRHQYNYLPWNVLNNKQVREKLKDGDVVGLLAKTNGLDITHMGFIFKDEKGIPHLFHASMKQGKVVKDPLQLSEYLHKSGLPGIRVVRIKE